MNTRRDFLKTSSLLGFGATVPAFLGRTALAAPPTGTAGGKDTILVVIQLTGGNDGLNTVIPYKNPDYYKYRPTIGIPKDQVKGIGGDVGLHPALDPLARLLNDRSAVGVLQAIGYPNPSQSHFRSMDIWNAASTAESLTEGWVGKALKQAPIPAFHLAKENETAPLALAGAPAKVPTIASLADFQLKTGGGSAAERDRQKKLIEDVAKPHASAVRGKPDLLDFVRRTAVTTYGTSDRLQTLGKEYNPKSPYPQTGLGTRLKLAAQLIDAGVGARIFYVTLDGFDTHAGQGGAIGAHSNLLGELAGAVSAFYRDLAERGHGDRVCAMTFSEFGRRAKENGSKGTDHGSAAPMFLVGGKVKPGPLGHHPSLTDLDDGNLKFATDFRRVYAGVLKDWLGLDPVPVVGKTFSPLPLFKA
ncbi:MAG TPA: DUF1501 domain-containing protein [Fimbriiglobus sp.]|jgi:uncharacterized protein (DUF1501 family)